MMEILQPMSLSDLTSALETDAYTKIIAGGTAVVLMMQQGLIAPERLVSLRCLPGLSGITEHDNHFTIGAMTTLRDVAGHAALRCESPALTSACASVGNIRIRNVATLGGNLAEADYASDPPSALVALNATVEICGPQGTRILSVEDLLTGFYSTTLESDEVITSISVPKASTITHQTYVKYKSRSSEDRPCVGVGACARLSNDKATVEELRVVVGAVAATPQRFPDIEAQATGSTLNEDIIDQLATDYAEAIDPIEDLRGSAWYRRRMTHVFVKQALSALAREGTMA